MATLILMLREFWLSCANWAGPRGNTTPCHSHEGRRGSYLSQPHPPTPSPSIRLWSHAESSSQTNICRCPENSANFFFCPLPSCYTAIRPDIICTIAPCWQCIESETWVFWELMLHWCPVAMGPQLRNEVMTFLFGHIVTYWVDTNYPDSLSTNLAAGSGQGSHSPIHGMAFEVTTTTVRL